MILTLLDVSVLGILLGILQFLTSLWVKSRLENSIKHEYDRKLEQLRFDIRKREQSARVAKLLALSFDRDSTAREFNELAWELSLWLPKNLVWELTRCLCGDTGAKDPKEVLIEIRKALNDGNDDGLVAGQIPHRNPRAPTPQP